MESEGVKEHFRKQSADYIGLMDRLVPQYMKQQEFLCKLIPFERNQAIRVLDLGSGPGVLSKFVLELFPQSQVVVLDLTEEMLEICKQHLAKFGERFEIRQGDFKTESFYSMFKITSYMV